MSGGHRGGGVRSGNRTGGPVTAGLIVVLCAALGFGLAVQVRRTAAGDTLGSLRAADLVQILDGLQQREDELTQEIRTQQDTLQKLQAGGASSGQALQEAERQAAALGILTGTVAAHGQGIVVTIKDPSGSVLPEVLLGAMQELRNAGAEAVQVGAVRIGVNSSFIGQRGAIVLDGVRLSQPYRIVAIGDAPTLAAALAIPGGVVDSVRRTGATAEVAQAQDVVIDALRAPQAPQYARPTG